MAVYAWARSRSLLAKLWSINDRATIKDKVELDQCNDLDERTTVSSKRFLNAVRDGGIFLS